MKNLKFSKIGTGSLRRWYIDLPDYPGDKEDCLMVQGADILLDIISGGGETMSLICSVNPEFEEHKKHIVLTKTPTPETDYIGGSWYYVSQYYFHIWLCDVTKFVFDGEFPEKIFCNF